jgi:hypothetical protein
MPFFAASANTGFIAFPDEERTETEAINRNCTILRHSFRIGAALAAIPARVYRAREFPRAALGGEKMGFFERQPKWHRLSAGGLTGFPGELSDI